MSKRALALKLAVVGVVAAAGVGIVASPASAYPPECLTFHYWLIRAETGLAQGDPGWYGLWVRAGDLIAEHGC